MNRLQRLAIGATAAALAWAALGTRPARLMSVRVTAITPDTPPVAHVSLTYGSGTRPIGLVIDIKKDGYYGSITLDGQTLYCDVLLMADCSRIDQISTSAWYRTIGVTIRITQQFN